MSKPQTKRKLFIFLLVACIILLLTLAIMLFKIYSIKKNVTDINDTNKAEISKVVKNDKKTDGLYYTAEDALHGYFSAIISGNERDTMNALAPNEFWIYLSKVYSVTEEKAFESVYFNWKATWDEYMEELNEYVDKDERYSTDKFMNTKIISIEAPSNEAKKVITTLFDLSDIDSQIQILNYVDNDFWDTDFNDGYSYCINGRWYYLPAYTIFALWHIYEDITGDSIETMSK